MPDSHDEWKEINNNNNNDSKSIQECNEKFKFLEGPYGKFKLIPHESVEELRKRWIEQYKHLAKWHKSLTRIIQS